MGKLTASERALLGRIGAYKAHSRHGGLEMTRAAREDLVVVGPKEEPPGHPEGSCTFRAHLSALFMAAHTRLANLISVARRRRRERPGAR